MSHTLRQRGFRNFFPKLFNVIFIASLLVSLTSPKPAFAASYRNWVAQQAGQPTPGQVVRVWMNSDTAFGETAGLEYHAGSTYTKVLGSFDTSYPGANWRVDLPASVQTLGTHVEYQLFTRNEFGTDYGFTGFNWNYDVTDIAHPLARSHKAQTSRSGFAPNTSTSRRSRSMFINSMPTMRPIPCSISMSLMIRMMAHTITGRRLSPCQTFLRSGITSGNSSVAMMASTVGQTASPIGTRTITLTTTTI